MTERIRNLVVLLNSRDKGIVNGAEVVKELEKAFNCYGSYAAMAKELFAELTAAGQKKLLFYTALAAMEMAHEWQAKGYDCWDDRKKASLSFSYNNRSYFERLFEKNEGHILSVDSGRSPYFLNCLDYKQVKDTCVEGFLNQWVLTHSTLKQSFFGGVVQGVLVGELKVKFIPPLDCSKVVFPLI